MVKLVLTDDKVGVRIVVTVEINVVYLRALWQPLTQYRFGNDDMLSMRLFFVSMRRLSALYVWIHDAPMIQSRTWKMVTMARYNGMAIIHAIMFSAVT